MKLLCGWGCFDKIFMNFNFTGFKVVFQKDFCNMSVVGKVENFSSVGKNWCNVFWRCANGSKQLQEPEYSKVQVWTEL